MATTPNFSFLESILENFALSRSFALNRNFVLGENFSLAAKEKTYPSSNRILRASESLSASLFQTLGVILLFTLLLQPLVPWLARPTTQNHTWEQTFPLPTSHQEKTISNYDAVSGSSLYCNGDPVNGLDPDGRCVEGMVTGQSYNVPSYAGALMGSMMPGFSTMQQIYSTAQTYNANYEAFGESNWNALNTTLNPAYAMLKGGYEAGTGFGMSPNNLGQDLSIRQRIASGVESVLGAAGTIGVAFGGVEFGGGLMQEEALTSQQNGLWPPNSGFLNTPNKAILQPGSIVDRFGGNNGIFVAPRGTAFESRSLPSEFINKPVNSFEVIKPIEINAGVSAPWFNQPGKGIQFELFNTVQELIDSGHLRHTGN